jgi:Zn-dependent protease
MQWMNGIKLFRVFGITVFLHWTWALLAAYQIFSGESVYSSRLWNTIEYLSLFGIVLLHEFGHALACRSVGGSAERIMLWPLGGVAYVSPPARPGAVLWSIAAGPLVNVALLFVTIPLVFLGVDGDLGQLISRIALINGSLLVFNMLPIYPLDGGQILQSLLWFLLGRGRSMAVATVIGLIGAVLLAVAALTIGHANYFALAIAVFVATRSWAGWQQGVQIRKRENAPHRQGFACPSCGKPPLVGEFWKCSNCQTKFDTFATNATCPGCGKQYNITSCGECGARSQFVNWQQLNAPVYQPTTAPPFLMPDAAPGNGNPIGAV